MITPSTYQPTAAALREMRRQWGRHASVELGKLLLINAIHAGMRISDGNKYVPASNWLESDSSETRARIRLLLPEFLQLAAAADAEPELANLADEPWERIWHDPLAASQVAVALLPNSNQARLTLAVNQLRRGDVLPAREHLITALQGATLRVEERSRYQRNLAACYELLGDDPGAAWFAERAVELNPGNQSNLLSYLIYAVIAPDASKRIPKLRNACLRYGRQFRASHVWSMLSQNGGRASESLNSDPDFACHLRKVLHSVS